MTFYLQNIYGTCSLSLCVLQLKNPIKSFPLVFKVAAILVRVTLMAFVTFFFRDRLLALYEYPLEAFSPCT